MNKFTSIIILLTFFVYSAFAQLTDVQRAELPFKNLITNPEFENGKTGWSTSGGDSFTLVTSTPAKKELGASYITWDSAGAGRILSHTAVTIDEANKNTNALCEFTTEVPSGTATHLIRAYDGTNVILSASIVSTTTPYKNSLSFPMPSSGSVYCQLVSVASNEPLIRVYRGWLGGNYRLGEVSQATLYGAQEIAGAGSCYYTGTNSSSYNNYSADSDCSTPTLYGFANTTAGKIPGVSFPSLPPGRYRVYAQFGNDFGAQNLGCSFRISDGTLSSAANRSSPGGSNGDSLVDRSVEGVFEYNTVQGAKTFQIQSATSSGSGTCDLANQITNDKFGIYVYRYPTSSQTIYSPETYNWFIDATITGGNATLATTDQSTPTTPNNSGWTLTNNTSKGAITANVTCSSTNAPGTTTCSSGSEETGINFTVPAPGAVQVCFEFGEALDANSSGQLYSAWQINETTSTSQTSIQTCGATVPGFTADGADGARVDRVVHQNICGVCYFSSAGSKTVRLQNLVEYGAGTINTHELFATTTGATGNLNVKITARPWNQNTPAPVLIGGVMNSGSGQYYVEGGNVTCSSSSAINSQVAGSNLFSSIGNVSSGACAITFGRTLPSANYWCTATGTSANSTPRAFAIPAKSTTGLTIDGIVVATAADITTEAIDILCLVPR